MHAQTAHAQNAHDRPAEPAPAPPQRVRSEALLRGARRLAIEHDGQTYVLHLTRQNRLLLTK